MPSVSDKRAVFNTASVVLPTYKLRLASGLVVDVPLLPKGGEDLWKASRRLLEGFEKANPNWRDEPRDAQGRWTEAGGLLAETGEGQQDDHQKVRNAVLLLSRDRDATVPLIMAHTGLSEKDVRNAVSSLSQQGRIVRDGAGFRVNETGQEVKGPTRTHTRKYEQGALFLRSGAPTRQAWAEQPAPAPAPSKPTNLFGEEEQQATTSLFGDEEIPQRPEGPVARPFKAPDPPYDHSEFYLLMEGPAPSGGQQLSLDFEKALPPRRPFLFLHRSGPRCR